MGGCFSNRLLHQWFTTNSTEFNRAHSMFSKPVFLSSSSTRFATANSSAVGQRDRLDKYNSSIISASDLPDFNKFATRVVPSPLTRSVTTGELIIIIACTGLALSLDCGGTL